MGLTCAIGRSRPWLLHFYWRLARPEGGLRGSGARRRLVTQQTRPDRAGIGGARSLCADRRHPIKVPATERDHLNTWLSRRIQQIAAPHLAGAGYSLLGGRLLSDSGKPAALFMYQDAAGKRLTVFVAQSEEREGTGYQHIVREDLRAVGWSEGPLTLAVTGPVDAVRLREIGEMVRQSVKG